MSQESANLKFFVCGDTTPPKRNHGHDCGHDLFVPNFTDDFCRELMQKNPGQPIKWSIVGPGSDGKENPNEGFYIQINPFQDIVIPSYVRARFDPEWVMDIGDKSGVSTLQHLKVGANTVDSSYQGIVHIHVFNTTSVPQFISFGQKLAQIRMLRQDNLENEVWFDESIGKFKDYKNQTTMEKFYEGHITPRGEGWQGNANGNVAQATGKTEEVKE